MRYFLITFLLIPIFYSSAKDVSDASSPRPPMGSVTTRSNTPVVTRSSDVKSTKPTDRSKAIWYPKGKAPKYKLNQPAKTSEEEDTNTVKGIFKEEAKGYRKEAARLQANNDLNGALTFYKKALEFDPNDIETINDIGVLYESLNDTVSAAVMYKKTLELNPQYLPAYTNLAFLYEAKNDTRNATYYWQKRYELGREGEYWTNIAKQHLIDLGTYPDVYRAKMDKEASLMVQDLAYGRVEKAKDNIKDARLHYYIGTRLSSKKDYGAALKEFESALALNPQDEELRLQIMDSYKSAEEAYAKDKIISETQDALNSIKDDNYYTAEEKLRSALSTVYRASQEK
ncbi:MAG: tetratricopeptide repeat protein [Candidatus Omnitrophica bacterium]|nr:tetratricopeptide repeat protein [Candidatus Omnitrophota bacterium]